MAPRTRCFEHGGPALQDDPEEVRRRLGEHVDEHATTGLVDWDRGRSSRGPLVVMAVEDGERGLFQIGERQGRFGVFFLRDFASLGASATASR